MRPNHHQFIAFAYVVREGSFSRAAGRLGVTQSTVTQHVANLEKQVGSQLLLRSREGVEVTRTGQEFYDLADRLVSLDSAISERLEGFEAMERGHLRVIANAPQPGLRAIREFRSRYPQVEVDFALHDWTAVTSMLRDRRADVALLTDPPRTDDWDYHPLTTMRYVAYLPPDSKLNHRANLSLRDLAEETVIIPEQGSLTERVIRTALRTHNISFPRTIRMRTFPLMCEAVLEGIGVAIFLGESGYISRGLREAPIQELSAAHEISIVTPTDLSRLRLVRAFVESASDIEAVRN